jgi:glutathione S-transferase
LQVAADNQETAMTTATTYTDPVVIERMPDHLRGSHRAARNWGSYPHNGAERVIVERSDTEQWCYDAEKDAHSGIEADEYDRILRDAAQADFERYKAE